MSVCQNCGATNEAGRETCTVCGISLNQPAEGSVAALARLAQLDHAPATDDVIETVPDWLELLLAKHGEEAPMLVKEELTVAADEGTASTRPPAPAGPQEPPTPDGPTPLPGDAEEIPEWVTDLGQADETEDGAEETPPVTGITDELDDLRAIFAEHDSGDASQPPEEPPIEEVEEVLPVITDTGEIPGWVRELGLVDGDISPTADKTAKPPEPSLDAEKQPLPIEVEEGGGLPEWLGRLVTPESPEQTQEEAPSAPGESDEQPMPLEGVSVPEDEVEAVADGEIPTWLAELGISETEATSVEQSPTGELPDWLHEMDVVQSHRRPEASEPEPPLPSSTEEAVPSPPGGEQVPEGAAGTDEDSPDWLADLRSASMADTIASAGEPAKAPTAEEAKTPDHLAELRSLVNTTQKTASLESGEEMPPSAEKIPDWLREMATEPTEPELPPAVEPSPESPPAIAEELAPAEIPEWVARLKPEEEAVFELREPEGAMEKLPEPMPFTDEPDVEDEAIEDLRAQLGIPEVPDVEGAALIREITSEQPDVPPDLDQEPKRSRIFTTIAWVLIFMVLILGIIVSLLAVVERVENLLGGPAFHRFLETPSAAGLVASVQTFRDEIVTLPPDSVVLVCFDYSPATEAEMDPLAETVMRDLLNHQARVITVSLQPEGAMMAQRLLDRFESDYPYGQRTLNLGYLPGQTAGVRSLAFLPELALFRGTNETLDDYPAWQDVKGLDDVALVVEVADSARTVRWWVEQAPPSPLADRPMLAAVSASAAPTIRPYHNAGQLQGMISGVTAAAAYEIYLGQPARATRSLAAQSAAHVGLVVVALVGTFAGFTSHTAEHT
jgi:hypothetical protein